MLRRRTLVIPPLLVVASLVFALVSAPAPAFSFPQFGNSIHDYAVDLDSDGDYDELRIDFTVTIRENATYRFEAFLGNDTQSYLLYASLDSPLGIGEHTLTVAFLGPYLHKADARGPYNVLFKGSVFVGDVIWGASEKTYATAFYDPASFDPPWAQFVDPITDEGRDTNGDGLFEQIVIRASIEALKGVVVQARASASVYGTDGWAPIGTPYGDSRRLTPGTWSMEFALDTLPLYTIRADGPYTVDMSLYVEGLGPIDLRPHTTQPYSHMSFRRPSADFRAPGPSVGLVDSDDNGLADFLVVRVPLSVTEPGDFVVSASLWVSAYAGGLFTSARSAHLEPGAHTVEVPFSGIALSRPEASGVWSLEVEVNRADASEFDRNRTAGFIPGYLPTAFETRPLAYLTGHLLTPGGLWLWQCGSVALLDPSTKFSARAEVYAGTFSLPVYSGTFVVLARSCGSPSQSRTSTLNVSNDTSADFPLRNATADAVDRDLNLTSWNAVRRTTRTRLADIAPEARFSADLLGNQDGFANATELRIVRDMESTYFSQPPFPGELTVDGRPLAWQSFVSFDVEGAGPVISDAELAETFVTDARSLMDPIGPRHNVTLRLYTDTPRRTFRATLRLPPGATGTFTSSGNVTVVPIGPGAWAIDPGTSPGSGMDAIYAYVYIDAMLEGPGILPTGAVEWILASVVVGGTFAGILWWTRRRRRGSGTEVQGPREPGEKGL